ncbi:hypothetical protein F5880DRAFT_359826 [Lentinula raphanica]|nr:hypothetical protein F5880DRAFT_359826 [Lentinula raphanica]
MTTRSISIIDSQAMKFYIITGLLVVLISAICTTTAAVPLGNYGIGVSTKQRWAYDGCAPGANGNAVPKVGDACELFGARPGICRKKLTNILPNQPSLECVQAGCRSSQYQQFKIGSVCNFDPWTKGRCRRNNVIKSMTEGSLICAKE